MRRPSPARPLLTNFLAGPTARIRLCKSIKNIALVISVTDLEIEEAIRDAWTIQQVGPDVPPSARRLAAALLALTLGTPAQPHWVTPDDLWRDRLAVLAEHGAWLLDWGPRPGEPNCRVPPALLPEIRAQRESAYALWRSAARTSSEVTADHKTARKRGSRSRRQDSAEETSSERKEARRGKSSVRSPESL
jgi:hypothetical protein